MCISDTGRQRKVCITSQNIIGDTNAGVCLLLAAFIVCIGDPQPQAGSGSEADAHCALSQYLSPPLSTSAAVCVAQHHPTDLHSFLSVKARLLPSIKLKLNKSNNPKGTANLQLDRRAFLAVCRARRCFLCLFFLLDHSRHQTGLHTR